MASAGVRTARLSHVGAALLLVQILLLVGSTAQGAKLKQITVEPKDIVLYGPRAVQQLVVMGRFSDDTEKDLTRKAAFKSLNPKIAEVSKKGGLVSAVSDGDTMIKVWVNDGTKEGKTVHIKVSVTDTLNRQRISFFNEVIPTLTKMGCNQGSCHGAQYGKGGFKLSLLGYEPELDYDVVSRQGEGRRVKKADPDQSLLLLKSTMRVNHGGGKRFEVGSWAYLLIRDWVLQGAPPSDGKEPTVTRIEVIPDKRILEVGEQQQIVARAYYSDGTVEDVTRKAKLDSNNTGIATVTPDGLVTAVLSGETAIMVRYMGHATVFRVIVPFGKIDPYPNLPKNNFIDEFVQAKWKVLGLLPSELCSDEEFIRRAYLDCIGTLPTPDEVRKFLASKDPDKRKKLIDELLERPEWVDFWALKFGDILRNNRNVLDDKGMWTWHLWIRESLLQNKPYDQFIRELVTAQGSTFENGPANYFRRASNPPDLAETTSQVFLGIRIQCAKCHHHPFEQWSQDDYWGLAAFFARVRVKGTQEFGLFGRESRVFLASSGEVNHPKKGITMKPTPLLGKPIDNPNGDRLKALADWLTSPDNPFVAKSIVNRIWGYFMGRGIVEPIDDMRVTNPPTNPSLLDALAKDFIEHKFDLKHLMRTIMNSRTYQLSGKATKQNAKDEMFYSHYFVKRLTAEQLFDAVCYATGVPEKFPGLPPGYRAIQLPDPNYPSYFLDIFGRPKREIACECERVGEPNISQALHIINSDFVNNKVLNPNGRVAQLLKSGKNDQQMIEELYLVTFSRLPKPDEMKRALQLIAQAPSRKEALEDLLWALMNSDEFLFNH